MVVLRSDLEGFWLFSAVISVPFLGVAMWALGDGDLAGGFAVLALAVLVGAATSAVARRLYGENRVLATDGGLVDVRRGKEREVVPWADCGAITVDGGNFWAFTNREWELAHVHVVLDRPIRMADRTYPGRWVGNCLIVKHDNRLRILDEAQRALAASRPSAP